MWYQVLVPAPVLMIPILIMTTKGTQSQTSDGGLPSDVIVTYSNHTDASHEAKPPDVPISTTTTTNKPVSLNIDYKSAEVVKNPRHENVTPEGNADTEKSQEDVIFIPNEKKEEKLRNEYYLQNEGASLSDLMAGHRTVEELLAAKDVRLETEPPVTDRIFVVGKNNENIKPEPEKDKQERKQDSPSREDMTTRAPRLRCNNLNCNNAIRSVCGEKMDDNNQPKLRLFLNDCYFRKVNCNFKNPASRYKKVTLDRCKNVGAHSPTQVSSPPKPFPKYTIKQEQANDTRRTISSRRSMTMNMHGQFCSHPCPVSCSEHYEPECAVSSTGRHRVFVNHCALDHNSCSFGIVWHSVPLSQCVGGKKAEMRQNAGFIGWMQRVGIVDKKGRLTYDFQ